MKSIKDLLQTAALPLGTAMYVWGGGWNAEDSGAGESAVTLGVSPKWKNFFELQDKNYDFKKHRFEIENGLDCSGFVGWTVYNTLCGESGGHGFVYPARETALRLARLGFGTYRATSEVSEIRAGDIMSSDAHTLIAIGECRDKSAIFIHSGPPGVQISGTSDGIAAPLCNFYMKTLRPVWHKKYPDSSRPANYLRGFSQMRWYTCGGVLSDAEGLTKMCAEDVLKAVFDI